MGGAGAVVRDCRVTEVRRYGIIGGEHDDVLKLVKKLQAAHPGTVLRFCYEAGPRGFALCRWTALGRSAWGEVERAEMFYGNLDDAQRAYVAHAVARSPFASVSTRVT